MFRLKQVLFGLIASVLLFAGFLITGASAATVPSLGTASSFAVLGGQTVTNTGPTVVTGNVGVSPGTAVTGFPPGIVNGGSIHSADATAVQAQSDVTGAYDNLASQPCTADLSGHDLGGRTLTAGVYCFTSSAQLTGTLTLDAQGSANAVFIFKIATTLTTASSSVVRLINGGSPCNVFWKVGSSATLNTTTTFLGNILALTSIALQNGASLDGRALARNGAVTLDSNTIGPNGCGGTPTPTPTAASTSTNTPVPAATATNTPAPASTATHTPVPAATATSTASATHTSVPTATHTSVPTATHTSVPTATHTPAPSPTATATPAPCDCDALVADFLLEQAHSGQLDRHEAQRLLNAFKEYLQDHPCRDAAATR